MTFKPGDKVAIIVDGVPRRISVVDHHIDGNRYMGTEGHTFRADWARLWQPGDDEAVQRTEDIEECEDFESWRALSAEDASTVASIVRRYGGRP